MHVGERVCGRRWEEESEWKRKWERLRESVSESERGWENLGDRENERERKGEREITKEREWVSESEWMCVCVCACVCVTWLHWIWVIAVFAASSSSVSSRFNVSFNLQDSRIILCCVACDENLYPEDNSSEKTYYYTVFFRICKCEKNHPQFNHSRTKYRADGIIDV